MAAPSGTVTFLFTDLEGSTELWRDSPAAMERALEQHDDVLRISIGQFGGYVFTTAGDSFAAAFARADAALHCAIEIQRRATTVEWPEGASLRIRMGLHTGEAQERDGDYFGPAVNRAARVMGLAHGGQIVVSVATQEIAVDSARGELTFRDLGVHELKGLGEPARLFQVVAEGMTDEFPSLPIASGNLPDAREELIGRDADLEAISRMLDESRLCTVIGVGGIGKTRLAVAAAHRIARRSRSGVWLVELASIDDGLFVPQAAADAIGCRQHAGRTVTESVVEFLRRRTALLVLDNCEHVLGSAAELVDAILGGAPEVRILTTSREALGLRSERSYPLASLATGEQGSPSEELFCRRAAEIAPHLRWSDEQLRATRQICTRLDGMPLAIELAASRCRSMTPIDIASRLDKAFLDVRGARRTVDRHQTLKAAIDWSVDALDDGERMLFGRLSVFASGWDIGAAEAVGGGHGVDEGEVIDLLDSLVARSLVTVTAATDGTTRFRMLEPIRQYAEDRLSSSGDMARARESHLAWAASWLEAWTRQLPTQDTRWRDALNENFADIRKAVEWGCQQHAVDHLVRLIDRLVPAVQLFVRLEIGAWAERILDLPDAERHSRISIVFAVAAAVRWWRGDSERMADLGLRGAEFAQGHPELFYPAVGEATWIGMNGDAEGATRRIQETEAATDAEAVIRLYHLSNWATPKVVDDEILTACAAMTERTGSSLPAAVGAFIEARVVLAKSRVEEAAAMAHHAIDLSSRIGATFFVSRGATVLTATADAQGSVNPETASAAAEALRDMSDSGQHQDQWPILKNVSFPLWRLGHRDTAYAVQRGYTNTAWVRSSRSVAREPGAERSEFERRAEAAQVELSEEDLVDQVLALLDDIAGDYGLRS